MTTSSRPRRRGRTTLIAVAACATALYGVIALPAPQARADVNELVVSSLAQSGSDAVPGDGVCATGSTTGPCTLLAALQEANALAITAGANPTIIRFDPDMPGDIVLTSAAPRMNAGYDTGLNDHGAVFEITAPYLTLDFGGQVGITVVDGTSTDTPQAVGILINAPHVVVQGFTNIETAETSMAVTAAGSDALIQDGTFSSPWAGERAVVLDDGAINTTIRDVTIHELYGDAAIRLRDNATVTGLRLERVVMDNVGGSPSNHYDGVGGDGSSTLVGGLIRDCTLSGFAGSHMPLNFSDVTLDGTIIEQNTFAGYDTSSELVLIEPNTTGSTSYIRNNMFTNQNAGMNHFIVVDQDFDSGDSNPLIIQGNTFTGMTDEAPLYLESVGNLRAERNVFGPGVYGGDAPGDETDEVALLRNDNDHANSQITTYYPTAAQYNPASGTVSLAVQAPTGSNEPQDPVTLDVYYTPASETSADVYVGRATGVTGQATLQLPWTLGAGKVRVHTIDALGRSSQYSRTIALTGLSDTTGPAVQVQRAPGQAATTSGRRMQFLVTFSEPPTGLVAANLSTSCSTAAGVEVMDVRAVGTATYIVTMSAASTGDVCLTLPAGAVSDSSGNPSQASTSLTPDLQPGANIVHYQVPLTFATPQGQVSQVPGDCATYTVSLAYADAPATYAPEARIQVTPTLAAPFEATITPNPAYIERNQTSTTFQVCAAPGAQVTDGTITVSHAISSPDFDYNFASLGQIELPAVDMTPVWTLTVSSNPPSGAAVAEGATVTFTAVAQHTGGAATPITLQWDLSATLDDATYQPASLTLTVDSQPVTLSQALVPDAARHLTLPVVTLPVGGQVIATVVVLVTTIPTQAGNNGQVIPTAAAGDGHVTATIAALAPEDAGATVTEPSTGPTPGTVTGDGQPQPCNQADTTDLTCRTASAAVAAMRITMTGPATLSGTPSPSTPSPSTPSPSTPSPGTALDAVVDPGVHAPASDPVSITPGTVTWVYTVSNVGAAPIEDLAVLDSQLGAISCPASRLDPAALPLVCLGSGPVGTPVGVP